MTERDASKSALSDGASTDAAQEHGEGTLHVTGSESLLTRWDLWVVLAALAILSAAGLTLRSMTAPEFDEFRLRGLSFARPRGFLPPTPIPAAASPLASALGTIEPPPPSDGSDASADAGPVAVPAAPPAPAEYHVVYQAPSAPLLRLEVRIADRPIYNNLLGSLSIERAARYGTSHWASESRIDNIGGRDWTRTEFRYAFKASDTDSPRVASAIEYASLNANLLYVVTFHGTPSQAKELAGMVAPTLSLREIEP